jgi:hypothetical protein
MDWLGPASDPLKAERLEEHKNHHLAFKRMPVADCPAKIPVRWFEALEHNQKIPSCCRHPENHDIVSLYSSNDDKAKGVPDIYIFICKERHDLGINKKHKDKPNAEDFRRIGEAHHRRFCVGGGTRPGWEVR